jgi:hypothetical protein
MERSRFVAIDEQRLAELARQLVAGPGYEPPQLDPAHHYVGDAASTLAYIVTLDAVNFGSGWFPYLRKRPGCSGYFTLSTALAEHFDTRGPWSAEALRSISASDCARIFAQDLALPEIAELMALFGRALNQLGAFLGERCEGSFEGLIDRAQCSAERLVRMLGEMDFYRDVSPYESFEVPFYKRAQITAADLFLAFEGRGFGDFDDLDRLTIFADNLVPHVLRWEGALVYSPQLASRIDAGELIAHDSPQEVEIRAAAVHAVEWMTRLLASEAEAAGRGEAPPVTARELDHILWNRGQLPTVKAHPRHRTRTTAY